VQRFGTHGARDVRATFRYLNRQVAVKALGAGRVSALGEDEAREGGEWLRQGADRTFHQHY